MNLSRDEGYSAQVDNVFDSIASKRIKDNFLFNYVLTRAWRTTQLWLNIHTNNQLLTFLSPIPRIIRRPILGGFLLLKIFIYALFIFSLIDLAGKIQRHDLIWHDYLTIFAAFAVISRTVLIGVLLGLGEHRYVLMAWPAMLWCAVSAIISIKTYTHKRSLGFTPVPVGASGDGGFK